MRPVRSRTLVLLAIALGAFAANSLLCRAALGRGAIDALGFTGVRLAAGALTLGLLALLRRAPLRAAASGPAALALFAYAILFSLAYLRLPAAVGALALFGAVQATMIGRGLVLGERLAGRAAVGLTVCLAGLVGLLLPGLEAPDPASLAMMLAAGVAWGVYSLIGRGAPEPVAANAAAFLLAAPLALLALAVGPKAHVTGTGLVLAAVSGAVTSGLGYAVWYAALRGLRATQAAVAQLAVPPLAALGAVAFLGETLSSRLVVCAAAILGGIALTLRRP
jgi:drug/metabolite transporter (DMT)-like permease